MSLKTWIAEFYPVPAEETRKKDALDHSILKWEGLQPAALEKHGLRLNSGTLMEGPDWSMPFFRINDDSCALCVYYYDEDAELDGCCKQCPIVKQAGCECCEGEKNPWHAFIKGDAAPMLDLLRQVKKGT